MHAFVKDILESPRLERPIGYARRNTHKLWDWANDFLLNIETRQSASGPGALLKLPDHRGIQSDVAAHDDNNEYQGVDYSNFPAIVRGFSLGPDDVFYDIGCGKGRVLCLVARMRLRRVVGVELFEELCAVARRNAARLRGKKTPIDIISADATKVDYSDGTAFYLWNPFGESTMRAFLKNLRASVQKNPRTIRIGYLKPVCEQVVEGESWLERYDEYKTPTASRMVYWRSRPA